MNINSLFGLVGKLYNFAFSIQTKPYAATALILNNGKVLAVSRKNNKSDFGLPGGKIEEGETPEEACIRELKEETGLVVDKNDIEEAFTKTDDNGNLTKTFFVHHYSGAINSSEEGKVAWKSKQDLINGSFGNYNKALFESIGLIN